MLLEKLVAKLVKRLVTIVLVVLLMVNLTCPQKICFAPSKLGVVWLLTFPQVCIDRIIYREVIALSDEAESLDYLKHC